MRYVKRTIDGYKPRDLLLAGLPIPDMQALETRLGRVPSGSATCDNDPVRSDGTRRTGHIVLDSDKRPVGVHLFPAWPLLIEPPVWDLRDDRRFVRAHRRRNGVIEGTWERRSRIPQGVPRAVEGDTRRDGPVRPVTFDTSVLLTGLRTALFKPTDRLFVSAAVMHDVAPMCVIEAVDPLPWESKGSVWFDVVGTILPVPLGGAAIVAAKYGPSSTPDLRDVDEAANLDYSDYIAAITAITYESPLYTVKPEAYEGIGGGLKVIEYGPVRYKYPGWQEDTDVTPVVVGHRGAYRGSPEYVPPPTPGPAPLYEDGKAFDLRVLTQREQDLGADQLARDLGDLLTTPGAQPDDEWLIEFLTNALAVATLVENADHEAHAEFILAIWSLTASAQLGAQHEEFMAHLRTAIGILGRWPDDVTDDLMYDLESDEEFAAQWYPVFLAMANVSAERIEQELTDVRNGAAKASRARIDELAPHTD